jgi:hypothetical protein
LQEEAAVLYNDVKESNEEASMVKFAMSLPYFLTKTNLKQKMYIEYGLVDIILAQLSKAELQDSKDAARSLNFFIRASLKKQKKLPSNFVGFPPQTPEFGVALNDEMLSDCVFNVDGKKIYASKAILATRSDYFRKLFLCGMKESFSKEIVVTDMEYDIFYKVMQFLYTNTLNLASHDEAVKLLIAADRYQLDYLKLRCAEYLREIIDTDNFDTLLELAFLFNAHTLQVQTVGYTLRLWKSIDKIIEAVMSAQPATSGSDFKSSMKQGESTNYINEKQQKLLDYWNFKEESSVREKEKMLKNMMSDKLFTDKIKSFCNDIIVSLNKSQNHVK